MIEFDVIMRDWVKKYQLFLFDFDGLLVNTEEIHYQAYVRMMANRGLKLTWSFERYCRAAHYGATALKDQFYQEFSELKGISWDILYKEKQKEIIHLVEEKGVSLMPGAEELLLKLEEEKIRRVVVTHSPRHLIDAIKKKNPCLSSIPNWLTRESYNEPKPHPECYIKAVSLYSQEGDKMIGFEDTPRGLRALLETCAAPILICKTPYPEIEYFKAQGVKHFSTLKDIPKEGP